MRRHRGRRTQAPGHPPCEPAIGGALRAQERPRARQCHRRAQRIHARIAALQDLRRMDGHHRRGEERGLEGRGRRRLVAPLRLAHESERECDRGHARQQREAAERRRPVADGPGPGVEREIVERRVHVEGRTLEHLRDRVLGEAPGERLVARQAGHAEQPGAAGEAGEHGGHAEGEQDPLRPGRRRARRLRGARQGHGRESVARATARRPWPRPRARPSPRAWPPRACGRPRAGAPPRA